MQSSLSPLLRPKFEASVSQENRGPLDSSCRGVPPGDAGAPRLLGNCRAATDGPGPRNSALTTTTPSPAWGWAGRGSLHGDPNYQKLQ
ncbi:unnamed protein product [Arctogadus glacialis]